MQPAQFSLDVDTGVDDALALVYLLGQPGRRSGRHRLDRWKRAVDQVCENNLGLLELCGITDIPVSKGSEPPLPDAVAHRRGHPRPEGLGYARIAADRRRLTDYDSAEAWVRAAHAFPGELIGVATGPLTNLALALRAEPALPTLLRRLVIMGGAFDYRGNTTPVAEWNISVDPESAAEVFAAGPAWGLEPHAPSDPLGLDLTEPSR